MSANMYGVVRLFILSHTRTRVRIDVSKQGTEDKYGAADVVCRLRMYRHVHAQVHLRTH